MNREEFKPSPVPSLYCLAVPGRRAQAFPVERALGLRVFLDRYRMISHYIARAVMNELSCRLSLA
jgi:hypothetical protein